MEISQSPLSTFDPMGPNRLAAEAKATRLEAGQEQMRLDSSAAPGTEPLDATKEAFEDFVGQTFFGELIKSFRSTQQPSAYFHGGRAEEIFQGQFDQLMSEKLSDDSAEQISGPMYELFRLGRHG